MGLGRNYTHEVLSGLVVVVVAVAVHRLVMKMKNLMNPKMRVEQKTIQQQYDVHKPIFRFLLVGIDAEFLLFLNFHFLSSSLI